MLSQETKCVQITNTIDCVLLHVCHYQIRKIEFLLADTLQQGCDSVITSGGIQSNHARTTAVAARQLGMQPHLVLLWKGEIVS